MDNDTESIIQLPIPTAAPETTALVDYLHRAREKGIDLSYNKRHRFESDWKAAIFADFDDARATVRGKREALVIVDADVRGGIALDRNAIEAVFPNLLPAFDHLIATKRDKDQEYDPGRDLIVLFEIDPRPVYHGTPVDGFVAWRVAGTCHFRQFPVPQDPKAERRAFGSMVD